MDLIYLILPVALIGSMYSIKEVRRLRLRRDKAKAIQLHQEMCTLRKAMEQAGNEA